MPKSKFALDNKGTQDTPETKTESRIKNKEPLGGRQFTSTEEILELLEALLQQNCLDLEIASALDISLATLYLWKKKHVEVYDLFKKYKGSQVKQVEAALARRAFGYEYRETTEELNRETGQMEMTKRVTKFEAPHPTAQIFYLKNRSPAKWNRDKEYEHGGGSRRKVDNVLVSLPGNDRDVPTVDPDDPDIDLTEEDGES
jgi:hypothetical protein